MDSLLRKWKLKKNDMFDNFLIFTQTNWYQRQVALCSNIDLTLTKKGENIYNKKVDSLFYGANETISFGEGYKEYDNEIKKNYVLKDNEIHVDVIGTVANWKELIYYKKPYLVVEYIWKGEDDEEHKAQQIYEPCEEN